MSLFARFHLPVLAALTACLVAAAAISLVCWPGPVAAAPLDRDRGGGLPVTQVVTVTTTSDVEDGDTSSVAALRASPGADGVISFREALKAANNSTGKKSIVFAPELAGQVIYNQNDGWEIMTGGDISIDGDTNGDGAPDIILDGSLAAPGPASNALYIWSSNITIARLGIRNFASGVPIMVAQPQGYPDGYSISGLHFLSNTITASGAGIGIGPLGMLDSCAVSTTTHIAISDVEIVGNVLTTTVPNASGIMLMAAAAGASYGSIVSGTISDNYLNGFVNDISLLAADTDTTWHHGCALPARYSDYSYIRDFVIAGNVMDHMLYNGILLAGANMGNSYNEVSGIKVTGNSITGLPGQYHFGIKVITAGAGSGIDRTMTGNVISDVLIAGNFLTDTAWSIALMSSDSDYSVPHLAIAGNSLVSGTITANTIISSGDSGITVWAARTVSRPMEAATTYTATGNLVSGMEISANNILTGVYHWEPSIGIGVVSGWSNRICPECIAGNEIQGIRITGNLVQAHDIGIRAFSGMGAGAVSNTLQGGIYGNQFADVGTVFAIAANKDGAQWNVLAGDWLRRVFLPVALRQAGP